MRWAVRSYGRPERKGLVGGANAGGATREDQDSGGGQLEGNLSLPLKVPLSASLPL